jgi:hypothetical protein
VSVGLQAGSSALFLRNYPLILFSEYRDYLDVADNVLVELLQIAHRYPARISILASETRRLYTGAFGLGRFSHVPSKQFVVVVLSQIVVLPF